MQHAEIVPKSDFMHKESSLKDCIVKFYHQRAQSLGDNFSLSQSVSGCCRITVSLSALRMYHSCAIYLTKCYEAGLFVLALLNSYTLVKTPTFAWETQKNVFK